MGTFIDWVRICNRKDIWKLEIIKNYSKIVWVVNDVEGIRLIYLCLRLKRIYMLWIPNKLTLTTCIKVFWNFEIQLDDITKDSENCGRKKDSYDWLRSETKGVVIRIGVCGFGADKQHKYTILGLTRINNVKLLND